MEGRRWETSRRCWQSPWSLEEAAGEGREEIKENVIGSWKEGDPCYVVAEGSGALLPAENRKHP